MKIPKRNINNLQKLAIKGRVIFFYMGPVLSLTILNLKALTFNEGIRNLLDSRRHNMNRRSLYLFWKEVGEFNWPSN